MKELYCDMASVSAVAMKELYCDMATVSAVATAAAAGVVCNDAEKDVHIYNGDISAFQESEEASSSPPSATHVTLSV